MKPVISRVPLVLFFVALSVFGQCRTGLLYDGQCIRLGPGFKVANGVLTVEASAAQPSSGWNYRGTWASGTEYAARNLVTYRGSTYLADRPNRNHAPGTNDGTWSLIAAAGTTGADGHDGPPGPPNFVLRGKWNSAQAYGSGDIVTDSSGANWMALTYQAPGSAPPGPPAWLSVSQAPNSGPTLTMFIGRRVSPPHAANAPCFPGDWADGPNYHYACIAMNTWRRAAWDASWKTSQP